MCPSGQRRTYNVIVGQLPKQPSETFSVTVDFTAELSGAETVSTCAVTSRNYADATDSSATFLAGAAVIATPRVSQKCVAGTHGQTHIVQFRMTTSQGNIYEHEVEVLVSES
jgi:hypothetical protein